MTFEMKKAEKMQAFLNANYFTLSKFAKQGDLQEVDILAMEKAQVIPGHTYEIRHLKTVSCAGINTALSEYPSINTEYYYHKSILHWVKSAQRQLNNSTMAEVAQQVKIQFASELQTQLQGQKTPGCQSFDQAWSYWIDGTWGKCLREISCHCLARKELARLRITEFMSSPNSELDVNQKIQLTQSVKQYIDASLDFDPYGMRHLVAVEPISKYNLDINYKKTYITIF